MNFPIHASNYGISMSFIPFIVIKTHLVCKMFSYLGFNKILFTLEMFEYRSNFAYSLTLAGSLLGNSTT